jgi:hypothetical protein
MPTFASLKGNKPPGDDAKIVYKCKIKKVKRK